MAGFILANGALSGGGEEYKIRKTLVENNIVEAILVLPNDMFYTTNISVTLWILNKNKKSHSRSVGGDQRNYRDRNQEILFMDLRKIGEPFEKKYIQFSEDQIKSIGKDYHAWQLLNGEYKDVPEYCYSASIDEIRQNDFSLVPSKYIEFIDKDENLDFSEKMETLRLSISELLKDELSSREKMLNVLKEIGYEVKL
jgi:type I restriction enzyme M protein